MRVGKIRLCSETGWVGWKFWKERNVEKSHSCVNLEREEES
jgi:hypothetical protein